MSMPCICHFFPRMVGSFLKSGKSTETTIYDEKIQILKYTSKNSIDWYWPTLHKSTGYFFAFSIIFFKIHSRKSTSNVLAARSNEINTTPMDVAISPLNWFWVDQKGWLSVSLEVFPSTVTLCIGSKGAWLRRLEHNCPTHAPNCKTRDRGLLSSMFSLNSFKSFLSAEFSIEFKESNVISLWIIMFVAFGTETLRVVVQGNAWKASYDRKLPYLSNDTKQRRIVFLFFFGSVTVWTCMKNLW